MTLRPIHAPKAVPRMAGTWHVDRVDHDLIPLSVFDRAVEVGIRQSGATEYVDTTGYQDDFTACRTMRPSLDQIAQRKIGAHSRGWYGEPQGSGSMAVIGREVLHDIDGSMLHIADPYCRRRRLRFDEVAEVSELGAESRVGSVVQ